MKNKFGISNEELKNYTAEELEHTRNHENYTDRDVEIIKRSQGKNTAELMRIKEEILTASVLQRKIKDTRDVIKAIEENISGMGGKISQETKDIIGNLKKSIEINLNKLEEIKNKEEEEEVPELEEIYN